MKIIHFSEINKQIENGEGEFIAACDAEYENCCKHAAEKIAKMRHERPLILLSGPSGSGKTTTALKIEAYLDNMGVETHTISMDDYFLPKEKMPELADGEKVDYESPYRIDIALLQEHMHRLARYEEVDIPAFDFPNQQRVQGKKLKRKRGEMILFEGIHALNPEVTGYEDISNRLYVSVRTRIQLANGELLHPQMIRLMRRIIRDRNFRNRTPAETLDMYDSVQQGENLYIAPYKHLANFELDTFLGYEASVYKNYLAGDIDSLKYSYDSFLRFSPMENAIKDLDSVKAEEVSESSMVREFIGGSKYEY